jgi:hypothetical protein
MALADQDTHMLLSLLPLLGGREVWLSLDELLPSPLQNNQASNYINIFSLIAKYYRIRTSKC